MTTMDNWPKVSVVILNWNGMFFLRDLMIACLKTVLDTDYPDVEVILVDNGSRDGSIEYIKRRLNYNSRLKIIRLPKNLGFPKGNNIGFAKSEGKFVIFLNNDAVPQMNWLKELVKVMLSDERIGIAQSKLVRLDNNRIIDAAGIFLSIIGLPVVRGSGETDHGQYDKICEIFAASGAAMCVRREAFKEVGGFDENFFFNLEDDDLSWRIRMKGYHIVFVPSSVILHMRGGSTTIDDLYYFKIFHDTKNYLMNAIKNYPTILWILLTILKIFVIQLINSIKNRKRRRGIIEALKAYYWVIQNLRFIYQKRVFNYTYLCKYKKKNFLKEIKRFTIPRI